MDEDIRKIKRVTQAQNTIRSSVNPKGNCSIQINLICMTKDEEMMSIEVERIRPDHALRNSSKKEIKVTKEKLKATNYWQKVPESSLVSVMFAKFTKKFLMLLQRNSAEKSCSLSNLVV